MLAADQNAELKERNRERDERVTEVSEEKRKRCWVKIFS